MENEKLKKEICRSLEDAIKDEESGTTLYDDLQALLRRIGEEPDADTIDYIRRSEERHKIVLETMKQRLCKEVM